MLGFRTSVYEFRRRQECVMQFSPNTRIGLVSIGGLHQRCWTSPGPMMHLRPKCGTCSLETSDSNCIPYCPPPFYQEDYCCCSVSQSCPVLWDPMNWSTPGFPIHHQLPELAQTHVHQVGDAIQSPHSLLSPSPPGFSFSKHQGLFQWVSSSHQMAKVLELQLQHQFFQWICRNWFPLGWTGWISLQSKGLSRVLSSTTVQKTSILQCSAFFMV